MLNNIVIGKYVKRDSFYHERTPLLKIWMTIFIIIALLLCDTLINALLLSILLLGVIILSKIPIIVFLRTLKGIRWILCCLVLFFIVFKIDMGIALLTCYRLIMVLFMSIWLTSTTHLTGMVYGIENLLSPLKLVRVNVASLAFTIALAIRFIPTILESSNKILKSQASRGADYEHGSFKNKIIIVKALIIPLFVASIRRADELGDALTMRFYKINNKKVYTNIKSWGILDTILCLIYGLLPVILYIGRG